MNFRNAIGGMYLHALMCKFLQQVRRNDLKLSGSFATCKLILRKRTEWQILDLFRQFGVWTVFQGFKMRTFQISTEIFYRDSVTHYQEKSKSIVQKLR